MSIETQPKTKDYNRRLRRKARSLMFWLRLTEQDVLDTFACLPNAQLVGSGHKQFVFIEGTRKDRVLLVAHADTVWTDKAIDPVYHNGVYFSKNNFGIGADDRAGCAILWRLRDMGHSLLICNKEEIGCVGSEFFMSDKERGETLNKTHQFAIQFDRRGSSDLVYYSVGSDPFNTWCEENFKGYKKAWGSSTDIRRLCTKMCGVNISTGYYNEHTSQERLIEQEWLRTLESARKVLSGNDIPRFEIPPAPVYNYNNHYHHRQQYDYADDYYQQHQQQSRNYSSNTHNINVGKARYDTDSIVVCPFCSAMMDQYEYELNNCSCVYADCDKKF